MAIYNSPFGDIKDLYYGNAAEWLLSSPALNQNPDKVVLVDAANGDSITGGQVLSWIGKVHYILETKYGIKYDDVVCLFAPNSIHIPVVQHGILSTGAIVSPANVAYNESELGFQLRTANAKLLITCEQLDETARKAAAKSPSVRQVVHLVDLINEARNQNGTLPPVKLPGKSAAKKNAYYCFSSGTSGIPKCVMSSHVNLTSNSQQQIQSGRFFYTEDTTFGAVLPMSHIFGLSKFVFTVLYAGHLNVVFEKFDFELLLQSIAKYKIKQLHVVPPILVLFAKSPLVEKYPGVKNQVKYFLSGAAPLSKTLVDAVESRIGCKVGQAYGLTETSPQTTFFAWDVKKYNSASIGWLCAGQEARIVDEDGNDVKRGERGELYVRGPNIMRGYLNNEKANKEALTPDGWFRTGDIALVDETNQFHIVDRAKELIKSRGHQVAPAELEGMLLKHPNVADCAVIGVFNEDEASEFPRAFIVRQSKDKGSVLDIKHWLDQNVSRHKQLWGGIVELPAIPKSPSGKILRRLLRERTGDVVHGMKKTSKL